MITQNRWASGRQAHFRWGFAARRLPSATSIPFIFYLLSRKGDVDFDFPVSSANMGRCCSSRWRDFTSLWTHVNEAYENSLSGPFQILKPLSPWQYFFFLLIFVRNIIFFLRKKYLTNKTIQTPNQPHESGFPAISRKHSIYCEFI